MFADVPSYDQQKQTLSNQLSALQEPQTEDLLVEPWVDQLLRLGRLTELDRATLAQTVKEILVYEDLRIEITYLFSDNLRVLPESAPGTSTDEFC